MNDPLQVNEEREVQINEDRGGFQIHNQQTGDLLQAALQDIDIVPEEMEKICSKKRKRELPIINRLNYEESQTIDVIETGITGLDPVSYFTEIFNNINPNLTFEANLAKYLTFKHGFNNVYFAKEQNNDQEIRISLNKTSCIISLPLNFDHIIKVLHTFPYESIYVLLDQEDMIVDEEQNKIEITTQSLMFVLFMFIEQSILKERSVPGLIPLFKIFKFPQNIKMNAIKTDQIFITK